jgi:hypothetical protein
LVFSSDRADFGFKIEFVRDTEDPSRVFRAFSGLIDFCQVTDKTLIKSLDLDIEPDLRLDNIEQGSIIVWLKNVLKSANENTLHNLDGERLLSRPVMRLKLKLRLYQNMILKES